MCWSVCLSVCHTHRCVLHSCAHDMCTFVYILPEGIRALPGSLGAALRAGHRALLPPGVLCRRQPGELRGARKSARIGGGVWVFRNGKRVSLSQGLGVTAQRGAIIFELLVARRSSLGHQAPPSRRGTEPETPQEMVVLGLSGLG